MPIEIGLRRCAEQLAQHRHVECRCLARAADRRLQRFGRALDHPSERPARRGVAPLLPKDVLRHRTVRNRLEPGPVQSGKQHAGVAVTQVGFSSGRRRQPTHDPPRRCGHRNRNRRARTTARRSSRRWRYRAKARARVPGRRRRNARARRNIAGERRSRGSGPGRAIRPDARTLSGDFRGTAARSRPATTPIPRRPLPRREAPPVPTGPAIRAPLVSAYVAALETIFFAASAVAGDHPPRLDHSGQGREGSRAPTAPSTRGAMPKNLIFWCGTQRARCSIFRMAVA